MNIVNISNMENSKYFTLYEMIHSATATRQGITNVPTWTQVENLNRLATYLLDPIRERYGFPLLVTSGFRCTLLNSIVGGVANSQHCKGLAVDLVCNDLDKLFSIIKESGLDYDQLIRESNGKSKWIHVSIAEKGKTPRKQVLTIKK